MRARYGRPASDRHRAACGLLGEMRLVADDPELVAEQDQLRAARDSHQRRVSDESASTCAGAPNSSTWYARQSSSSACPATRLSAAIEQARRALPGVHQAGRHAPGAAGPGLRRPGARSAGSGRRTMTHIGTRRHQRPENERERRPARYYRKRITMTARTTRAGTTTSSTSRRSPQTTVRSRPRRPKPRSPSAWRLPPFSSTCASAARTAVRSWRRDPALGPRRPPHESRSRAGRRCRCQPVGRLSG